MSDGDVGPPTVGYYVHHHGSGHRARFEKIRALSRIDLIALSELPIDGGLRLAGDVPSTPGDPTAGGVLHWAPIAAPGPAHRAHQIVDWIMQTNPRGVVVDVSVETALLCRLAGVATVVMRQHGDRTDTAHTTAYSAAARLIAPFPRELEHPLTPEWVVDKTDHVGFIAGRTGDGGSDLSSDVPTPDDVVVLWGTGGGTFGRNDLDALIVAAMPGRVWTIGSRIEHRGAEVIDVGWIDGVEAMLAHRPVVVASAGNNAVADAACAGSPLVVVPQARPFDEQARHAESLDRAEVASIAPSGCDAAMWVSALELARRRAGGLAALGADRNGARAAAAAIERAVGIHS